MDRSEKIQLIKTQVREKVLGRVKKTALSYQADEIIVRRQTEIVLDAVLREKMEDAADEGLRRFLIEEVINDVFGLGPIDRFVKDPSVWEIMVNGPKEIYVEREGKLQKTDSFFENEKQLFFYIERILSPSGRRVSELEPYIDARLPDGSRLNVVRNPVAPFGPIMTIRKANRRILEAQDLIARHTIDERVARFLKACVKNHLNIVIAGGPGSGKTTILNILSTHIPETERIITIEDTLELRMLNKHRVALETRPQTVEGRGEITIRSLVRNSLHMRPDRIIIGEVRGEEALDMLQCMNIGQVGSMTTMHANSPLDALLRLETMAMMGSTSLAAELIRRQIVSAIDLVIHLNRSNDGVRYITAISELVKIDPLQYVLKDIYAFRRAHGQDAAGVGLKATGYVPVFIDKFYDMDPGLLEDFK